MIILENKKFRQKCKKVLSQILVKLSLKNVLELVKHYSIVTVKFGSYQKQEIKKKLKIPL